MNSYNYLKGTIWCVPRTKNSLTAVRYSTSSSSEVVVQVIWIIEDVKNNYVYGKCYSYFGNYATANLFGMISPDGKLQFNFYGEQNVYSTGIIKLNIPDKFFNGYRNKYIIHMQVNIPMEEGTYLMHNSLMVEIKKNSQYYQKLPGTRIFNNGQSLSVDEFISKATL
jgi:hypothetical protein